MQNCRCGNGPHHGGNHVERVERAMNEVARERARQWPRADVVQQKPGQMLRDIAVLSDLEHDVDHCP